MLRYCKQPLRRSKLDSSVRHFTRADLKVLKSDRPKTCWRGHPSFAVNAKEGSRSEILADFLFSRWGAVTRCAVRTKTCNPIFWLSTERSRAIQTLPSGFPNRRRAERSHASNLSTINWGTRNNCLQDSGRQHTCLQADALLLLVFDHECRPRCLHEIRQAWGAENQQTG
jgi:hypothetical protein